jgi:plastocyanin
MMPNNFIGVICNSLIYIFMLFISINASAAEVTAIVIDANGKPLSDAVVYLEGSRPNKIESSAIKADIEQKSKHFNPLVTVVQTGSSINFPNKDTVRHHVYSFSPAKKFELKLYSGVPANPVVFDKAGTVVLGCNIHDSMLAYVYVVDTPYYGKTDKTGQIKISNIADGKYELKVWHYALQQEDTPSSQIVNLIGEKNFSVKLVINDANLVTDR